MCRLVPQKECHNCRHNLHSIYIFRLICVSQISAKCVLTLHNCRLPYSWICEYESMQNCPFFQIHSTFYRQIPTFTVDRIHWHDRPFFLPFKTLLNLFKLRLHLVLYKGAIHRWHHEGGRWTGQGPQCWRMHKEAWRAGSKKCPKIAWRHLWTTPSLYSIIFINQRYIYKIYKKWLSITFWPKASYFRSFSLAESEPYCGLYYLYILHKSNSWFSKVLLTQSIFLTFGVIQWIYINQYVQKCFFGSKVAYSHIAAI